MSLPADPRKKASCSANASQADATVTSTTNNIEETCDSAISPSTNTNSNINTSDGDEVILATAGYDHTIKFWQAHTGQCIRTLQHADSQVNALALDPADGQLLAAAGYQHIRMFDVNSNNASPVVNYEGVSKNVMAVGFQEAGRWMYTGGEDGTAKIWDLRMRNLNCQRIFQANAPVNSVTLHPNQHELIVGDQNGAVHIWNLRADTSEAHTPEQGSSIQCVTIDIHGRSMAAVTNKGNCFVTTPPSEAALLDDDSNNHDKVTGPPPSSSILPTKKISAHKRYGLKCKFSPDSSVLITSSADQTCKLWRTSDYSMISELIVENQRWVWDVAFSADSQYLFTASSDNLARLWSLPNESNDFSYEVKRTYKENGHQKAVTCLAFRDGNGNAPSQ